MSTRSIKTEAQRETLLLFLKSKKLPLTVQITSGRIRSGEQNRLQRKWIGEIAEQLEGETTEDVRAYCKLRFGIPILRAENPEFKASYDRVIGGLSYEQKIEAMQQPLDMPITRLMSVDQKARYLADMSRYYTAQGVILTIPIAA